jgi:two-component system, chemotaxis family, protein-glutamate methylesterase/glutaminase
MIRVVCADDSPFLRQVLKETLISSGKFDVIGEARNGKEAIEQVKALKPDILILDCEMPVMNGLEALRHIMEECPLPVFIFSSLAKEGAGVTLKALEYGAVDYLAKPTAGAHSMAEVKDEMIAKLELIGRKNRWRQQAAGAGAARVVPVTRPAVVGTSRPAEVARRHVDIIAIGSSTGGVQAAVELVKRLPKVSRPIVWVQHMPPTFTGSFAARLNTLGSVRVYEAKNGQVLEDNSCYIAPGGFQMRVRRTASQAVLNIGGIDRVNGFCPSCDPLFDSVAQFYGANAVGVILTGMGDDGSRGLLNMRKKGAFVVGQDEASCVVYGMPKAAFQAGAVDVQEDLFHIADVLAKLGAVG